MEAIISWLMDDRQNDLFETLIALILNILFLALSSLILWPLDRLILALELARGYLIFWVVAVVTASLLNLVHRLLRWNIYDYANAYTISILIVSCLLHLGWAAFAALAITNSVAEASLWTRIVVYLIGGLSCLSAFWIAGAFYQGAIYKLISLPVILVSFLIFCIWPDSSSALFGWLR